MLLPYLEISGLNPTNEKKFGKESFPPNGALRGTNSEIIRLEYQTSNEKLKKNHKLYLYSGRTMIFIDINVILSKKVWTSDRFFGLIWLRLNLNTES